MSEHLLSNSAAVPIEVQAREEAEMALAPYRPRREQLIAALGSTEVKDDEDLRRAADKMILAKALREEADAKLQPIGTPYKSATHAVANVATEFVGGLKQAETSLQKRIDAFRSRQREAAARAANEQAAREAELRKEAGLESAPVQAVKPSDVRLPSARSDYRGHVFDRKVLVVTITDPRALPDTILKSPNVTAALEAAVRQLAKLDRNIPGATIEDDQKSTVKAG